MPSTTAKWISFCSHRNRKGIGGKHDVLVHYVDVSAPNSEGVVLCNPFKWDILWFILIENHVVVFVPSIAAKWISFRNHKTRKVVGGKHSVLVLYVNASASNPSCFVLCNPFKWDIFYSFLIKNQVVVVCVPSTPWKQILYINHRNRKVVGVKHNVLVHFVNASAPDQAGVVLINPFKWEFLWFILIENLFIFVCLP